MDWNLITQKEEVYKPEYEKEDIKLTKIFDKSKYGSFLTFLPKMQTQVPEISIR